MASVPPAPGRGSTTTFCPRLQRAPITAPGITWQKCQTFVPAPMAPLVTYPEYLTTDQDFITLLGLRTSKTADTRFSRDWTWVIEKTGDQTSLTLSTGQVFQVDGGIRL